MFIPRNLCKSVTTSPVFYIECYRGNRHQVSQLYRGTMGSNQMVNTAGSWWNQTRQLSQVYKVRILHVSAQSSDCVVHAIMTHKILKHEGKIQTLNCFFWLEQIYPFITVTLVHLALSWHVSAPLYYYKYHSISTIWSVSTQPYVNVSQDVTSRKYRLQCP